MMIMLYVQLLLIVQMYLKSVVSALKKCSQM